MDNNTTYTYIGGEITFGSSAINSGFGIDSSLVRYIYIENEGDKYDKYRDSVYKVITELIKDIDSLTSRVNALENNKVYTVGSITLDNLTCAELSSAKTIPVSGATFTITPKTGYSLPDTVTVTNADKEWNQSTGELRIYDVIGEITVSASAVANKPNEIKICNESGTSLDNDQTIYGKNKTLKIKVTVSGEKSLITSQSKFKVTEIPSGIGITFKKNGTTTNVTSSTELDKDTVLTITGKSLMTAGANLTVTATANTSVTDSLFIKVNEGSITGVSISPTSQTFNANGESKTFTATLDHNMFNLPDLSSGFKWTIGGTNPNMFSGSSTSNSITITSNKNDSSSDTKSGTLSVNYKYNNIDVNSDLASLTINKQSVSYYWYVGQEAVTPNNYTTISGVTQVTSYPTKYEYTPPARAYVYVLIANNKTVTKFEDANLGSSISFTLDDTIKITGYSVYRSLVKISGKIYIHIS